MRPFVFSLAAIIICTLAGNSQSFPPAAGFPGSSAVHKDSSAIVNWAVSAEIIRGPQDITKPDSPPAAYGNKTDALGKADGKVVSLGDGGQIILKFQNPISNGTGPDFAVFENGFRQDSTSHNAFLELAFVEVSSDCEHYIRFPAVSEIQSDTQTATYAQTDARFIHNFAGKYTLNYGTAFDLEELKNKDSKLDITNISCIKIIDVIGSIDTNYASYDSFGNIINDPFPTPFESGGFDLDALAILHEKSNAAQVDKLIVENPVSGDLYFPSGFPDKGTLKIFSPSAKLMTSVELNKNTHKLSAGNLEKGLYILHFQTEKELYSAKIIKL
jgi:hypothetical protein